MNEFIKKLIERLDYLLNHFGEHCEEWGSDKEGDCRRKSCADCVLKHAIEIVSQVAEEYGDGWIPVSSGKFPEVEKEVFIQTKRGDITTAIYEDGTMYSGDSIWNWYDCDFEWDDEKEDYIISQGWWEYRHFNSYDVYNNIVDDEVIAWQPLPEPYQPKGE